MKIGGYAIPFGRPGNIDSNTVEHCNKGAIKIDSVANIRLIFGDHIVEGRSIYAQTRDGSLTLFNDDYGLGFVAEISDKRADAWGMFQPVARGEVRQCSVNFIHQEHDAQLNLTTGLIDHIAMVSEPAYWDTGVWVMSNSIDDLHPHVREMSAYHAHSYENFLSSRGRMVHTAAEPGRRGAARHPSSRSRAGHAAASRPWVAKSAINTVVVPASVRALLNMPDVKAMVRL